MKNDPSKTYIETKETCREILATINEMKKTLAEMKACTQGNNTKAEQTSKKQN